MNPTTVNWFTTLTQTTDNVVTPLIDGLAALSEIQSHINALSAGDFCCYGAWIMYADSTTLPGATQTLLEEFIAAIGRGADVRISLYVGMPDAGGQRQSHLRVKNDIGAAGGEVIIDIHHPVQGSQHQKYAIFGKQLATGEYQLTAFCGGIDPVYDRIDDPQHSATGILGVYHGWHDVHSKVEGPAAAYIWYDFASRWNENLDAWSFLRTTVTPINTGAYTISTALPVGMKHHVEILNTYSCSVSLGYSFVPSNGLQTIHEAYLNAIANAQHYIYIESPFFVDEDISNALRSKLMQTPTVQIIVLTNLYGEAGGYYLNENFSIIRQALASTTHFHPCQLVYADGTPIYVHSKLMIVDDVYYTLGSANITPRSMTLDSELNIGVVGDDVITYTHESVDYEVRQSARDLRVALWMEHLQLTSSSDLLEIPTALATWIANLSLASSRIRICNASASQPSNEAEGYAWSSYHHLVAHPTDHCL